MLANTNDKVSEVLNRLVQSQEFTYDSETTGLDMHKDVICGHVFTFGPSPRDTYYVPVRHESDGNVDAQEFESTFAGILDANPKTIIGHNLAFDLAFLSKHEIIRFWNNHSFHDTMVEAYLINEMRASFSLDACCRDEGVQAKKGEMLYAYLADQFGGDPDRKQMANFYKADPRVDVIWDYAAGDGTSTHQLHNALVHQILKPDAQGYNLSTVWKVESALIPVLNRMRVRGVAMDMEQYDRVANHVVEALDQAEKATGGINVRSPKQVKEFLEKSGITDWPLTANGSPSFPEAWLKQSEQGRSIVAVRKWRTLRDSFIKPIHDQYLHEGRVHPEFHQTRDENYGTKTGRLSSSQPNFQAMPGKRQGDLGKLFRSMFVPDSKTWWEADFSNCEIRIATHYCGARTWVEGFKNGIDPHTSVANDVGLDRQHAKAINLGIMTGLGANGLAEQLGVSYEEAKKYFDQYYRGLPELKEWQNHAKQVFRSRGYVRTLLGRRLHLEPPKNVKGRLMEFSYRAVNRLTQGGNADLIKAKMVEMDAACANTDSYLMLNVHDSMSWDTDDEGVSKRLQEIMIDMKTGLIKMDVGMKIDVGTGPNWGEATFYE